MKFVICTSCGSQILIDDEDYERVSQFKWSCCNGKQVIGTVGTNQTWHLGRFILNYTGSLDVDHIDRDYHDNRKCNLRIATRSENLFNKAARKDSSSGLKGVSFDEVRGKWRVRIQAFGKRIEKRFDTKEQAIDEYNKLAKELHGAYANFITRQH